MRSTQAIEKRLQKVVDSELSQARLQRRPSWAAKFEGHEDPAMEKRLQQVVDEIGKETGKEKSVVNTL